MTVEQCEKALETAKKKWGVKTREGIDAISRRVAEKVGGLLRVDRRRAARSRDSTDFGEFSRVELCRSQAAIDRFRMGIDAYNPVHGIAHAGDSESHEPVRAASGERHALGGADRVSSASRKSSERGFACGRDSRCKARVRHCSVCYNLTRMTRAKLQRPRRDQGWFVCGAAQGSAGRWRGGALQGV